MSLRQRQRSCSSAARDIGGWTKVKDVKSIQIVRRPEEICKSRLSATGENFLNKALPFINQGKRHPVHIWEKKKSPRISSNKGLGVAVQTRRVKFCKHSVSGTYMQKCLLKGYLEDTP